MDKVYKEVPTWEAGVWSTTTFQTMEEFRDFLIPLLKVPGEYKFDATSFLFNAQARFYNQNKFYCSAPFRSKDYTTYWDTEKSKNRNGVIFKSNGETWYLTRDYYMWLNFLPIFDKEENLYGFAKVRDAQYHMALYEQLAELHHKHSAILKKRQIASSYYHAAKLINQIWFEEGITLKMGSVLKDKINEKGTWKFLTEYRNFLDEHTAWYRPMNPGKIMMWQQQIEVTKNSRKSLQGLKGTVQGLTFDKDATAGVGGPCRYFFYEEAGIAPTMDTTYEYLLPAMKSGMITTGMFIAAGSVGDLDQCEPLRKMILYPEVHDIYAVETDLIDEKGTIGTAGLFIPEQWSMPPYIDEFGNSLVKEALIAIHAERLIWKKDLEPNKYQLRVSQHPINIEEAFAARKESVFPLHLITAQQRRIEEKTYAYEFLDISRDANGKPQVKETRKLPITEFPLTPKTEDKEGVLIVWERPYKDNSFGTYYASIDPVSEGKTSTSDSLCAIYVYKTDVEVERMEGGEPIVALERGKIVAAWCGRFDDINQTHERLELIIEWYNAWTVVENNVSLFIRHMISQKKQRYLVPKDQMIFLKDLGSNSNVFQDYGWKNTGNLFKAHLLSYAIEYLKEALDHETKPDGTIVHTTYGVERIPDAMLLKEMAAYYIGLNVDRLVAFTAMIAFVKVQESSRGRKKRIEEDAQKYLDKSKKKVTFSKSPFVHMGGNKIEGALKNTHRSAFKNLK